MIGYKEQKIAKLQQELNKVRVVLNREKVSRSYLFKAITHLKELGHVPEKYVREKSSGYSYVDTPRIEKDLEVQQYLKGLSKTQREELLNDN